MLGQCMVLQCATTAAAYVKIDSNRFSGRFAKAQGVQAVGWMFGLFFLM